MSYITTPFDSFSHRQPVLDLWARNLPQGTAERYAWLYESGHATGWLLYGNEGEPVGSSGMMKRVFFLRGTPVAAGQAIDLNVDREHRSMGPALRLQRALKATVQEQGRGLIYAFPNAQSLAVLRRVGYRPLGGVERWYKPLRSENVLRRRLPHRLTRKLVGTAVDTMLRVKSPGILPGLPKQCRVDVTDRFDASFDQLWETASPQFPILGERTSAYLTWRFGQSPEGCYRAFRLSDAENRLLAYLVYCWEGQVVHVNDFFFRGLGDFRVLLAAFIRRMREEHAEAVTAVYLGPKEVSQCFSRSGFLQRPSPWTAVAYVDPEQGELQDDWIFDKDHWYLTRADVDTDL